jgi:nicotinate dehydrogenase subunit B
VRTRLATRRDVGKILGVMLASFAFPFPAKATSTKLPGDLQTSPLLDSWIRLDPDGRIVVLTGKAELGQGILTALAQIAAEELDVEIAQVQMISADTRKSPNETTSLMKSACRRRGGTRPLNIKPTLMSFSSGRIEQKARAAA